MTKEEEAREIDGKKDELSLSEKISLAEIYLSEWKHRDELFWRQIFKYFYTACIILFMPNIAYMLHIDIAGIPSKLFYLMALFMSFFFWYVAIGYAKRLEATSIVYDRLLNEIPGKFKRIHLTDSEIKYGKYFNVRLMYLICGMMFGLIVVLSIMRLL